MYHQTVSSRLIKSPSVVMPRVTVYCERRLECLSTSVDSTALIISLEKVPNRNPSRKAWEGPWVTGPLMSSSNINLKKRKMELKTLNK